MKRQCDCVYVIIALSSQHSLGNTYVPGTTLSAGDFKGKCGMWHVPTLTTQVKGAFLQCDGCGGRAPDRRGFKAELPAGLRPGDRGVERESHRPGV